MNPLKDWYYEEEKEDGSIELIPITSMEQIKKPRWMIKTRLNKHMTVSTVFLGLDHSFDEGRKKLYETMVFGANEEMMYRYSTRKAAIQGHEWVVKICDMNLMFGYTFYRKAYLIKKFLQKLFQKEV